MKIFNIILIAFILIFYITGCIVQKWCTDDICKIVTSDDPTYKDCTKNKYPDVLKQLAYTVERTKRGNNTN